MLLKKENKCIICEKEIVHKRGGTNIHTCSHKCSRIYTRIVNSVKTRIKKLLEKKMGLSK